jgi:hypothetical protein
MRCQCCNTNKHEHLYSYGGSNICFSCHEQYNPQTQTYHLLSEGTVKRLTDRKFQLEKELRDIQFQLDMTKRMKEEGVTQITTKIPR